MNPSHSCQFPVHFSSTVSPFTEDGMCAVSEPQTRRTRRPAVGPRRGWGVQLFGELCYIYRSLNVWIYVCMNIHMYMYIYNVCVQILQTVITICPCNASTPTGLVVFCFAVHVICLAICYQKILYKSRQLQLSLPETNPKLSLYGNDDINMVSSQVHYA